MRVLDLFAGMRGWSAPFAERGHDCRSVEMSEKFPGITYRMDILEFERRMDELLGPWRPDIILASPPCQGFSVMNIGRNWTRDHQPKTPQAQLAITLVLCAIRIIDGLKPAFHVIENPRAKLRKLPFMERFERRTVTYCHYGEKRMKPTDLWSYRWPPSLVLHPPCSNGALNADGTLHHLSAPRGSRTGTQGMESADSAKIPHALALAVCKAAERDMKNGQDGTSGGQLCLDLGS